MVTTIIFTIFHILIYKLILSVQNIAGHCNMPFNIQDCNTTNYNVYRWKHMNQGKYALIRGEKCIYKCIFLNKFGKQIVFRIFSVTILGNNTWPYTILVINAAQNRYYHEQ